MDNYGAGGVGAAAVLVIGVIYKLFHHFKCSSNCCGTKSSLDVSMGTPPTEKTQEKTLEVI